MATGQTSDRQRGRNSQKWIKKLFRQLRRPRTAWLFVSIGKLIVEIAKMFKD
jgi:hypothetical protein